MLRARPYRLGMQDRPASPLDPARATARLGLERDDDELLHPEDQQAPDRWAFNPWRRTREGTAAQRVTDAVISRLAACETRKRQRKQADAATFAAVVDAVVASLLRCQLDASQQDVDAEDEKRGWVRVPLSSRRLTPNAEQSRYDATPIPLGMLMTTRRKGKPERRGIVDAMADLELIYLDRAPRHSEATRASAIKCRTGMLELIAEHEPRLDELELLSCVVTADGDRVEPELIELREPLIEERSFGFIPLQTRIRSRSVEYPDGPTIEAWREEVRTINNGLANADILFDPGNGVINGHEVPEHGIALHDRMLKRIFNNGRWDHGGRLYGGFWQAMKRELRAGLRMDGHRVASLDFSAVYLQLLYTVMARRQTPIKGDLYAGIDPVEGWPADPDRKQAMRDAIKRNVSAMLFSRERDKPHRLVKNTKAALSKGMTGAVLQDRVEARHPDIAEWFRVPGIGFELMHHESEIMIHTVLRCLEQGVVVLPLHDGLLVAEPHRDVARTAMLEAFREHTGGFVARVSG